MTARGSNEPSAPALFHVEMAEMLGRGERIRTSGPCLPNALLLAVRVVLWALSLGPLCILMRHVRAWFAVEGSQRTFGPCALLPSHQGNDDD
jgi:hypothetical protein